jgi:hypothetical protein
MPLVRAPPGPHSGSAASPGDGRRSATRYGVLPLGPPPPPSPHCHRHPETPSLRCRPPIAMRHISGSAFAMLDLVNHFFLPPDPMPPVYFLLMPSPVFPSRVNPTDPLPQPSPPSLPSIPSQPWPQPPGQPKPHRCRCSPPNAYRPRSFIGGVLPMPPSVLQRCISVPHDFHSVGTPSNAPLFPTVPPRPQNG